ncbi:MAG: site-specific DNA-methyltransferase, partial [Deltaproteobacteria bacterium]|nr:site-specific DNA-methyltransferase [Deltaproteobacteria bacterium]
MLPVNQIVHGNALEVMRTFPAESIDCVLFSPPYFGKRFYGETVNTIWGGDSNCDHTWEETPPPRPRSESDVKDPESKQATVRGSVYNAPYGKFCSKCGAYFGQFGLEPDFRMYVQHLVEVGREIWRILKPGGSWWLNLGDTYASKPTGSLGASSWARPSRDQSTEARKQRGSGVREKCKLLIPHRVAIALIDDGWICRNDCVWYKPNAMPESVKDRLANKFEFVFHLVKQRRYYYDLDAIREPHSAATIERITQPTVFEQQGGAKQDALNPKRNGSRSNFNRPAEVVKSLARKYLPHEPRHFQLLAMGIGHGGHTGKTIRHDHPLGKNPGDVLQVATRVVQDKDYKTR